MVEKKGNILVLLQLIFSGSLLLLSIYSGMSKNFKLIPILLILMIAMFIVIWLRKHKQTKINQH